MTTKEQGACLKQFRKAVWAKQRELATEMAGERYSQMDEEDLKTAIGSIEDQISRWERGGRNPKKDFLRELAALAKRKGYSRRSGGHLISLLRDIYRIDTREEWMAAFDVIRSTTPRTGGAHYGGRLVVAGGKVTIDETAPSGATSAAIFDSFGGFNVWQVEGPGWAFVYERFQDVKSASFVPAGTVHSVILPKEQNLEIGSTLLLDGGAAFEEIAKYIRSKADGT